jgi:hypothetical protein
MLERWMYDSEPDGTLFEQEHLAVLAGRELYSAPLAAAEDDHRLYDSPQLTAYMRADSETLVISTYPALNMIVLTYPTYLRHGVWIGGVVRERVLGEGEELSAVFAAEVLRHEKEYGWKHAGGTA